jgi:hypothetical protein
MRQHHGHVAGDLPAQVTQQIFTAGEVLVPLWNIAPDDRNLGRGPLYGIDASPLRHPAHLLKSKRAIPLSVTLVSGFTNGAIQLSFR